MHKQEFLTPTSCFNAAPYACSPPKLLGQQSTHRARGSSETLVGLIINYSSIYVLHPHQVVNTFARWKVCAVYTGSYMYISRAAIKITCFRLFRTTATPSRNRRHTLKLATIFSEYFHVWFRLVGYQCFKHWCRQVVKKPVRGLFLVLIHQLFVSFYDPYVVHSQLHRNRDR